MYPFSTYTFDDSIKEWLAVEKCLSHWGQSSATHNDPPGDLKALWTEGTLMSNNPLTAPCRKNPDINLIPSAWQFQRPINPLSHPSTPHPLFPGAGAPWKLYGGCLILNLQIRLWAAQGNGVPLPYSFWFEWVRPLHPSFTRLSLTYIKKTKKHGSSGICCRKSVL